MPSTVHVVILMKKKRQLSLWGCCQPPPNRLVLGLRNKAIQVVGTYNELQHFASWLSVCTEPRASLWYMYVVPCSAVLGKVPNIELAHICGQKVPYKCCVLYLCTTCSNTRPVQSLCTQVCINMYSFIFYADISKKSAIEESILTTRCCSSLI